ncbi:MAG TPA: hypothetical protein VFP84_14535 [Kofleriaceae bacterium]|nr:hypothetical protein [Kofleriaceae bacterium]
MIAFAAAALPATRPAWAQEPPSAQEPSGPPGPPVYVAPLAQETQSTYVPQSVALSGPEEIEPIDDNRRAPAGYTPVFRKNRHLIVGGAVTLGVTYTVSSLVAAIGSDVGNGHNDVAALWIPVAGPFVQLGSTSSSTAKFFLVGLGGAQLAGAIMLFSGLSSNHRVFVRNDLVGDLAIGPLTAKGAQGLALSGRF